MRRVLAGSVLVLMMVRVPPSSPPHRAPSSGAAWGGCYPSSSWDPWDISCRGEALVCLGSREAAKLRARPGALGCKM